MAGTINITFWNLHGIGNLKGCSLMKFSDILATCETWCDNPPQIPPTSLAKYNIFWANAVREFAIGRASGGLLTAVNKKYSTIVLDTSPWWIFNLVTVDSTTLIIGSVYFRTCLDINYLLDLFQDTIDEIKTAYTYDAFILGGDTNAKVGSLNPWPEELFVGSVLQGKMSSSDESICNRGRRLIEFMLDNDFVLLNGRTPSDTPAQPTFDSVGTSIIDLVWINQQALHQVVDLEIILEPSLSDHRPVNLKIAAGEENTATHSHTKSTTRTTWIKWSDNAKDDFCRHLDSYTSSNNSTDLDSHYTALHSAILFASDKAKLLTTRNNSGHTPTARESPWYDTECKVAKREYRKSLRTCKKENFRQQARSESAKCKKNIKLYVALNKRNTTKDLVTPSTQSQCHPTSGQPLENYPPDLPCARPYQLIPGTTSIPRSILPDWMPHQYLIELPTTHWMAKSCTMNLRQYFHLSKLVKLLDQICFPTKSIKT